jgi:NDP-4-keto-2,6-dideoxyhexose 3-C-methyltransferase
MICVNCKKKIFQKIINLGKQPISSFFLKKKNFSLKKYSLALYKCNNCHLIQLKNHSDFQKVFRSEYGYQTSLSLMMIKHIKKKFKMLFKDSLKKNKLNILDIGSNDGTFLNFFSKYKRVSLYGIDPSAKNFLYNYHKRINLIDDFFSAKKIYDRFGKKLKNKFSLITSFAMFYDVKNPNEFCSDIKDLLTNDGIWVCEFSYFPLLLKNLTYDQICHEHIAYYTLTTFNNIITKNGLKIIDVFFNNINGGSIEVMCSVTDSKNKTNKEKIKKIFEDEKLINDSSFSNFSLRVDNVKRNLQLILRNTKKNILGYGASTKGNIVLNHCAISSADLRYICDANELKIGRYTPGTNIKIISKNLMRKINPDYLLVLIWSFKSEVIEQEIDYIFKGGKLIFHLPFIHIVDKSNYKKFLQDNLDIFSYSY